MPSCIVNQCGSRSGKKASSRDITLHKFPNDRERTKLWLQQSGQNFENIEVLADKIFNSRKQNKYALCSLHFLEDSYTVTSGGRFLKADALPKLFPPYIEGEPIIMENLKKDKRLSQKRPLELATVVNPNIEASTSTEGATFAIESKCTVGTQTDFTLSNCHMDYLPEHGLTPTSRLIGSSFTGPANPIFSTPVGTKSRSLLASLSECASPMRKRPNLEREFLEDPECLIEGSVPCSPIIGEVHELPSDSPPEEPSVSEFELDPRDTSFVPEKPSLDSSELQDYLSLFPHDASVAPKPAPIQKEKDMVSDRKLIIFENSLDILLYKVKCQFTDNCNSTVKSFKKLFEGTYFKVIGECFSGHKFTVLESQPKIGRYAAGNILLAGAILFSGQNFQKVSELFNVFGMVGISQTTFYRYQSLFLFPAIDIAWRKEQEQIKEKLLSKPLCVAGDGQCDSPGHSAKYCVYTMLDTVTGKILDFEVVQRSQCKSSVSMEKYGFTNCMNRLLSDGYTICIFASDKHVGIRKEMKEEFPRIKHQFDIWHYAKNLKKKLTAASKARLCKELIPWIDKVILHFWWCVQTCERDPHLLEEKWLSVLHHTVNRHAWDGLMYASCGHEQLDDEDHDLLWLQEGFPPHKSLQKIVSHPLLIKELPNLIHNCHTGRIENFHSLALKYRSKRIHFGIDAMEARTKLAALTHNKNVGRPQAVVHHEKKTSEPIGTKRTTLVLPKGKSRWFIRDVYEKVDVKYLEDVSVDVLLIAKGQLDSQWTSKAPGLPPNLANKERPNKEEIKRQRLTRFRSSGEPFFE